MQTRMLADRLARPASWRTRRLGPRPLRIAVMAITLPLWLGGCSESLDIPAASADAAPTRESLVSIARLEPSSRVINVATASNDVIKQVLVQDGNEVVKGQVLVLLESYQLRAAELEAERIQLERAALEPLEVEAQSARMRAIEAELEYAREEVGSQKDLSAKGFSAGREFRDAKLRVRRTEEELNEANAILERLEANAGLAEREARNRVYQAEARLEQTMIRSPIDGRVLRVLAKEGERVGSSAVVSVGSTQTMYAVAEVHANDIRMVKPGQRARFSSQALPGPIDGRVASVGEMILGNMITGEDPNAPLGLRVVEVRVELEGNELAQRMTNLEGQLRIFLQESASQ
ncbi:MAG: efflux RND transporter periplasmic adaptor subunit [Deltaproteobacteria bacterium]|nr:efflux RND transporter periplasmic adaptor subunit [Deltaproteobacteria bacterium]MBW2697900.1 efflux RND transporter periplasmic adaptor subunit [Deltaproteobacteria bacterium]